MYKGLLQIKAVSMCPGRIGIFSKIMNKYGIDGVPHLIFGCFKINK
ncbi:hypothetical protein [Blattabacterium punctulatus]|nr:hypothetical protein [Blattabacterium punctulatus]